MTTVYKVELCRGQFRENENRYYSDRNSAQTSLKNHERNCSDQHEIKEVELEENEWLCCYCKKLMTDTTECEKCGRWRHSLDAIPETELAQELFRKQTLETQGVDYEIDEEVIKNAEGVTI
jgi:ribosomal protein S14